MAGLACEIENKIAPFDQRQHRPCISNVGKFDRNTLANVMNIKQVAAELRNQAVHQRDFCAESEETMGERGTDETKTAGDEHIRFGKNVELGRHDEWNDGVLEYCKCNDNPDHAISPSLRWPGALGGDSYL